MNGEQCRNSQSQAKYIKMTVLHGLEVWPRKAMLAVPYEVKKKERLV